MHVGFVLLNCDLGAEEYILDELTKVPQIKKDVAKILTQLKKQG